MDLIERTTSTGTITGVPLYDGHGNNVATLTRSGSSFSLGDQRSYDAWGSVRTGASTGAPNSPYCASPGHVEHDESGLVCMRARYYEASTGRFVSEDQGRQGRNWYSYCENDPVNRVDKSGHSWKDVLKGILLFFGAKDFLGPLLSIVYKAFYRLSAGASEKACYSLDSLGNTLLASGRTDLALLEELLDTSSFGGSMGQMAMVGAQCSTLAIGGATKVAAGVMLKQAAYLMLLMAIEFEAGG